MPAAKDIGILPPLIPSRTSKIPEAQNNSTEYNLAKISPCRLAGSFAPLGGVFHSSVQRGVNPPLNVMPRLHDGASPLLKIKLLPKRFSLRRGEKEIGRKAAVYFSRLFSVKILFVTAVKKCDNLPYLFTVQAGVLISRLRFCMYFIAGHFSSEFLTSKGNLLRCPPTSLFILTCYVRNFSVSGCHLIICRSFSGKSIGAETNFSCCKAVKPLKYRIGHQPRYALYQNWCPVVAEREGFEPSERY